MTICKNTGCEPQFCCCQDCQDLSVFHGLIASASEMVGAVLITDPIMRKAAKKVFVSHTSLINIGPFQLWALAVRGVLVFEAKDYPRVRISRVLVEDQRNALVHKTLHPKEWDLHAQLGHRDRLNCLVNDHKVSFCLEGEELWVEGPRGRMRLA